MKLSLPPKPDPKPYPKLMASTNGELIVMANSVASGKLIGSVISQHGSLEHFGKYFDNLDPNHFYDFAGQVVLEND